ncbi:MAG: class I SAM-dependent RNA methyltransferase [Paracoccaceae bacterium]
MSVAAETVEVVALDAAGDGRDAAGGRHPGTLPGERLDGTGRVVRAAPERAAPPCPHAADCGGCTLQHASDAFVTAWKRERVVGALAAQGIEAPVEATLTVPARSRRRVALGARRTKSGATIGYRVQGSERIVPVAVCPVATPAIEAAIPRLVPLVERLASRKGTLRLTLAEAPAGLDLAVEGARRPPESPRERARHDGDLAMLAHDLGLARLAVDGEVVVMREPPVQPVGPARVLPPPGGFLQPTAEGARWLAAMVVEAVEASPVAPRRVADLFAGIGTFALPLARRARVAAFELDDAAVAAMTRGWREAAATAGLHRLDAGRRDLWRRPLTAEELSRFDAVVLDPPFAGAEAQARAIAASGVASVVSVSCNPASFARDARLMVEGGYRLERVRPVDQFRWSGHVEVVGVLRWG